MEKHIPIAGADGARPGGRRPAGHSRAGAAECRLHVGTRAAEVVRRFVAAGGGLIATFETSLYDQNYQKRADFALADLFRAKYVDDRHGLAAD